MSIRFRVERTKKFLISAYPSTGLVGFAARGDLVYKSSDLYAQSSSDLAGSTLGAILGIVEVASASTATLGQIAPVSGELLEIDYSTDYSTSIATATNIGRAFRISASTVIGTVIDLSTAPVKVTTYGSTVDAVTSTNKECFVVTGFDAVGGKAIGYIPNRFCNI